MPYNMQNFYEHLYINGQGRFKSFYEPQSTSASQSEINQVLGETLSAALLIRTGKLLAPLALATICALAAKNEYQAAGCSPDNPQVQKIFSEINALSYIHQAKIALRDGVSIDTHPGRTSKKDPSPTENICLGQPPYPVEQLVTPLTNEFDVATTAEGALYDAAKEYNNLGEQDHITALAGVASDITQNIPDGARQIDFDPKNDPYSTDVTQLDALEAQYQAELDKDWKDLQNTVGDHDYNGGLMMDVGILAMVGQFMVGIRSAAQRWGKSLQGVDGYDKSSGTQQSTAFRLQEEKKIRRERRQLDNTNAAASSHAPGAILAAMAQNRRYR